MSDPLLNSLNINPNSIAQDIPHPEQAVVPWPSGPRGLGGSALGRQRCQHQREQASLLSAAAPEVVHAACPLVVVEWRAERSHPVKRNKALVLKTF